MGSRWYIALVLLFWSASMSWLITAKVLPPLVGGRAPDYRAPLAEAAREPAPVAWKLIWEERPIGYAVTRIRQVADGQTEMRSLVQFEQLDVKRVLQQLLGGLAALMPSVGGENFQLEMTIAGRMRFDDRQELHTIDSSIAVADMPHVLNLHGEVNAPNTLDVVVFSGDHFSENPSGGSVLFRQRLDLPRDALVSDAFAPSSELKGLEVGQTWTIPVYRPFPPNSPVQIVEAKAERLDVIYWRQEPVETMVVAYRAEAGSGVSAAREPISRVWVRPDGVVLRQEVAISNLRLLFERLSEEEGAAYAENLNDEAFLPLLPAAPPSKQANASE